MGSKRLQLGVHSRVAARLPAAISRLAFRGRHTGSPDEAALLISARSDTLQHTGTVLRVPGNHPPQPETPRESANPVLALPYTDGY